MSFLLRRFLCLACFVSMALMLAGTGRADDIRTWTDGTGKFKIKARLDSVSDGKAVLVRENGKKTTIAIEKLCKADQEYIAEQALDNPFEPAEEQAEASAPATSNAPRTVTVDWSQSHTVLPNVIDSSWELTPTTIPQLDFKPKSVPLPPKTNFFDKISGMAVNRIAKAAVVGYELPRSGDKDSNIRLHLCDLQSGRITATAEFKGKLIPLAVNDDGRQILLRGNTFDLDLNGPMELWTVEGKKAVKMMEWVFKDDERKDQREKNDDVRWAEFLDGNRLITFSRVGKIVIWDLTSGQPLCDFTVDADGTPALSPDRKWIAFTANDAIGIFDIEKQDVIASQKLPRKMNKAHLAFSPSGQKIGCIDSEHILVWDTASGELKNDIGVPGLHTFHSGIVFPSDDYVLIGREYLIELKNQLKLWHYLKADHLATMGGTTFFAISGDDKSGALLAAAVPHAEALSILEKALANPDTFVFRKGVSVKLDVTGIPEAKRTDIQEVLTKKLGKMECPITDTSDLQIVATVEGPTQKDISFMHSGTYQVQEYRTWLKILYQGKTIWESSWTNIPHVVQIKHGENIEGVLRKAGEQPAYSFYDQVVLPEYVQNNAVKKQQGSEQTLGVSKLSAQGIR